MPKVSKKAVRKVRHTRASKIEQWYSKRYLLFEPEGMNLVATHLGLKTRDPKYKSAVSDLVHIFRDFDDEWWMLDRTKNTSRKSIRKLKTLSDRLDSALHALGERATNSLRELAFKTNPPRLYNESTKEYDERARGLVLSGLGEVREQLWGLSHACEKWLKNSQNGKRPGRPRQSAAHNLYENIFAVFVRYHDCDLETDESNSYEIELLNHMVEFTDAVLTLVAFPHPSKGEKTRNGYNGAFARLAEDFIRKKG